jgi:hypothetical protein
VASSVLPAHHLEAAQALGVLVGVGAVRQEAGVVPMQHVINLVLGEQLMQELGSEVVGHTCRAVHMQYMQCGGTPMSRNSGVRS